MVEGMTVDGLMESFMALMFFISIRPSPHHHAVRAGVMVGVMAADG